MERKIEIYTWEDRNAPSTFAWRAAYQENDLDVDTGVGLTERDAVFDLVENHDLPKQEVRK